MIITFTLLAGLLAMILNGYCAECSGADVSLAPIYVQVMLGLMALLVLATTPYGAFVENLGSGARVEDQMKRYGVDGVWHLARKCPLKSCACGCGGPLIDLDPPEAP